MAFQADCHGKRQQTPASLWDGLWDDPVGLPDGVTAGRGPGRWPNSHRPVASSGVWWRNAARDVADRRSG